jgi:ABC-type molybdate transport system substrate-binding protein
MTSPFSNIIAFAIGAVVATVPQTLGSQPHHVVAGPQQREISVLADTVSKSALLDAIAAFEKTHPNIVVRPHFVGSLVVAQQMRTGAEPDAVVLPATEAHAIGTLLDNVKPAFGDHTTIVVSRDARTRIHGPADLAAPGVRLGAGRAGTALAGIDAATVARIAPDAGFSARLAGNVAEEEHDTARHALVDGIAEGSLDAAIMYASDVVPGKSFEVPLPAAGRVFATYDAAVVRAGAQQDVARDFVAYITSVEGAATFRAHGHDPAV